MPHCAVALRSRFQNVMVVAWYGRGMSCVNKTRPRYVNRIGKTQSKLLAAQHGRGTAWYVLISISFNHFKQDANGTGPITSFKGLRKTTIPS
jgi:hypothetical protein